MESKELNKTQKAVVLVVSIVLPVVVALLFGVKIEGYDFSFLPPFYSGINALTAILLITALIAVKKKNFILHERIMKTALALSVVFLVCYVTYHITATTVRFGDLNHDDILDDNEAALVGNLRYLYYFILVTHIILSVAITPLLLITFVRAISKNFPAHKKIARITFPLWLYVAVTGVTVYLLISPYYG